jgi:hypothetical protein
VVVGFARSARRLENRRSSAPAPLCAAQRVELAPRLLRRARAEVGSERAGEPSLERVLLAGAAQRAWTIGRSAYCRLQIAGGRVAWPSRRARTSISLDLNNDS